MNQHKHYLFRWFRCTTWRGLKRRYWLDSRCRRRMDVRAELVGVRRIQLHGLRHAKYDVYRLWWHLCRQCQCQSGCPECPSWRELQIQFLASTRKGTCRDLVIDDGFSKSRSRWRSASYSAGFGKSGVTWSKNAPTILHRQPSAAFRRRARPRQAGACIIDLRPCLVGERTAASPD